MNMNRISNRCVVFNLAFGIRLNILLLLLSNFFLIFSRFWFDFYIVFDLRFWFDFLSKQKN
jgi:hypothetical protein